MPEYSSVIALTPGVGVWPVLSGYYQRLSRGSSYSVNGLLRNNGHVSRRKKVPKASILRNLMGKKLSIFLSFILNASIGVLDKKINIELSKKIISTKLNLSREWLFLKCGKNTFSYINKECNKTIINNLWYCIIQNFGK